MAKQQPALIQAGAHVASSRLVQNVQTALLLSLLSRGLLNERQFDRCVEELRCT